MKKDIYVCNIAQIDGLFEFVNTDNGKLNEKYNVLGGSEDNLNSVYDIVTNIIDEEPDVLLLYCYNNTVQLVLAVVAELIAQEFIDIIIYHEELDKSGCIEIANSNIKIINNVDLVLEEDINVFNNQISIKDFIGLEDEEIYTEQYTTAMKNGFDMYLTGRYSGSNYISNTKHIEIEKHAKIEDISPELLNINNALIYSVDKSSSDFFNEIKNNSDKPVYSHIHQLENNRIMFDNNDSKYDVKRIKYADYKYPSLLQAGSMILLISSGLQFQGANVSRFSPS